MRLIRFVSASKILLLICSFISFTSFAFNPPTKAASKKMLTSAAMSKLVNDAVLDPIFSLITQLDIERVQIIIDTKHVMSKEKWDELASKKTRSLEETEYVLSTFGFRSLDHFSKYVNLLITLDKKYGIDKLSKNDQKHFSDALRKKQYDSILEQALMERKHSAKLGPGTGGGPSECWKCVYDYRDCLSASYQVVISYTPLTTYTTSVNVSTSGGISISTTEFTTPSRATITYMNTSYNPQQCYDTYSICIQSCMY